MKYICPLITVADIGKARDFYEKILGQKVKYDFGENVTFEGDFAIHLKSHYQKLIDNREIKTGGNNFELYFEFDDIKQIEKKLIDNNIEFIHQTREQPWRQRVIRFYDLDKNIIEVGETLEFLSYRLFKEGKTITEISKIITLPIDFVKSSIQKLELKEYRGRVPACGCFCGGCPTYTRDKILVRELRLTAKDVKVVKHSIYVAKKKGLRIAMSVMNFHVKNLKVGLNVGKNMDKILLKIRRY